MKAEAQEKMSPLKPAHEMSASSESESDDDIESSISSDESDSSSSGDSNENDKSDGHAGDAAAKNGDSKDTDSDESDDSDSSSSDDSDSSSSSDSDSTSDESDSSESSSDKSEEKAQNEGPESSQVVSKTPLAPKAEESKRASVSPKKTQTPQRNIKHEEEELDAVSSSPTSELNKIQLSTSIIEGIVKDPAEFTVIDAPGPYTVEDISSENDYYIFRFPVGMLNPVQLADTKISLGNRESSVIQVNNRPFEAMAYEYEPGAETPTLFLPDKAGELKQVDLQIKSQVVIRQPTPQLNTADIVQFNIDDLRSRVHQPPEIRERNFFGSTGSTMLTVKKEKLSKEEKKLLKEQKRLSSGEGKHSKKAKKHKEEKESKEAKKIKKKEKKLAKELAKKRSIDSADILSPSSSLMKKIKKET